MTKDSGHWLQCNEFWSPKLFRAERIIPFKYPNINSPLVGSGTLSILLIGLMLIIATEFNRLFFSKQGGSIAGVFETDANNQGGWNLLVLVGK